MKMKEEIYTIPVNEVFSEECFCPFCKLYDRLEKEEIRYAVGPAMMETDYRKITNEKGFCKKHIKEVNALPKALALSLILESHFKKVKEALYKDFKPKKKLFKKDSNKIDEFIFDIAAFNHDCAICSKVERHFLRYIDTFIFMVKKDEEFLDKVSNGGGFCMPHYESVLYAARKKLSEKEFVRIIDKINKAQFKKFEKYEKDISEFIKSFDYNNAGKKEEAPKDTVLKSSYFLNGEFEKATKKLEDV